MTLEHVDRLVDALRAEIGKVIIGQDEAVELLLTSLLCGGHVLLEGVPGTGKTFLVQSFAAGLALEFGRIQFTPDMMPGDVLGTNLFNFQTNTFTLTRGPIFTQILLADEINRTPPKTQAALLQAMGERAVTIDRQTFDLGQDFMVVATQNPVEQQGTYPLPEAQLDRFLFKIVVDYPELEEERKIVALHGTSSAMPHMADFGVRPAVTREELRKPAESAPGFCFPSLWWSILWILCGARAAIPPLRLERPPVRQPCWPRLPALMPPFAGASSSFPTM